MREKQLTFTTMGGETVTVPLRGKHYVQPKGYAAPPGTGPAGETCKTCQHLVYNQMAKSYPKCDLNRARWTGGRGSDILVKAPACRLWEKSTA
jgi:hypothetical protein